jgi:hypothetical protein
MRKSHPEQRTGSVCHRRWHERARQLFLPTAARIGLLINPTNPNVEGVTKDVTAASSATGV